MVLGLFPVVLACVDCAVIVLVPAALAVRVEGDDAPIIHVPDGRGSEGKVGRAANDGDVVARRGFGLADSGIQRTVISATNRCAKVVKRLARPPLQRLGETTDVADAVLFLLSPASRWISGTNLVVDGGMSSAARW